MTDVIQQQLITARKNQILDAAAAVFAEKGFHPTTTKDIAKHAGISEGTIYNYFDSKSALLLAIFERMKATIISDHMPPTSDELDFRSFVRAFLFQPLLALKQDNFALFRIIISEIMVNEELRVLYHQQILEPTLALAESFFATQRRSAIETKLIIRAISALMLGLMLQYIMDDATLVAEWEHVPDVVTDLILNGLTDTR